MRPVMIHADGTDCDHAGTPVATMEDEGGPRCAGAQPVTHIRFNGKVLPASSAVQQVAGTWAQALAPLITSLATGMASLTDLLGPLTVTMRALAAASEVVEEERARHLSAVYGTCEHCGAPRDTRTTETDDLIVTELLCTGCGRVAGI